MYQLVFETYREVDSLVGGYLSNLIMSALTLIGGILIGIIGRKVKKMRSGEISPARQKAINLDNAYNYLLTYLNKKDLWKKKNDKVFYTVVKDDGPINHPFPHHPQCCDSKKYITIDFTQGISVTMPNGENIMQHLSDVGIFSRRDKVCKLAKKIKSHINDGEDAVKIKDMVV